MTVVKSRLLFGLTTRQVVCFGAAGAVGVPIFMFVNGFASSSVAMLCLIAAAFPAMVFAVYEKDGIPAEKMLLFYIRARFIFPTIRIYKVENMYEYIEQEGYFASESEETLAASKRKKPAKRK
jgi:hypothetical protein